MASESWPSALWRLVRPFPHVEQVERSDCGPAAVLAVLRYWGGNATLSDVRSLAGAGADGASMAGLGCAARALGLTPRAAEGCYEDLRGETMPCIAHLTLPDGLGHFVVVRRVGRRRVVVSDPAGRLDILSRAQFEGLWQSRSVLLVEVWDSTLLPRARESSWLRWAATYGRHEAAWLAQSLFLGLGSAAVALLTAVFIQTLVDRLIPLGDLRLTAIGSGTLLLLLIGKAAADRIRARFLIRLGRSASARAADDLLAHLLSQPSRFFEGRTIGDLCGRVRDGIPVYSGLVEASTVVVVEGSMLAGSMVMLLLLAPEIAWIPLAILPFYVVFTARRAEAIRRGHMRAASALGEAESALVDGLRGAPEIRHFGRASVFSGRLLGGFERMLDSAASVDETRAGLGFASAVASSLLMVTCLWVGAAKVITGELMLGGFMAGYSLLTGAVGSVNRIAGAVVRGKEVQVDALRARSLLAFGRRVGPSPTLGRIREGLRLEFLGSMRFQPADGPTRAMEFPVDVVTVVCGPSGVGKTTLLQMLAGEGSSPSARLLVDGRPQDDLSIPEYRSRIGVLPSRSHVFRDSLAFNVLLGRPGLDAPGALSALEALGFRSFMDRFPGRWNTLVGEGRRALSTGERQIMGLMRALVGQPDVLLVDEGLVGIDAELRPVLLQAILEFSRRRVLVLASHEPGVLSVADRIIQLVPARLAPEPELASADIR